MIRYALVLFPLKLLIEITGAPVTVTTVEPAPAPCSVTPLLLLGVMPLPQEYDPAANVIVAPSVALLMAACTWENRTSRRATPGGAGTTACRICGNSQHEEQGSQKKPKHEIPPYRFVESRCLVAVTVGQVAFRAARQMRIYSRVRASKRDSFGCPTQGPLLCRCHTSA